MAKILFLVVVLLMVTTVHQVSASHGCTSGYGCIYPKLAEYNRKMLLALKRSSATTENEKNKFNDAELRSVPAGPDPLHHNGGNPKRPRRNSP